MDDYTLRRFGLYPCELVCMNDRAELEVWRFDGKWWHIYIGDAVFPNESFQLNKTVTPVDFDREILGVL